MADYIVRSYICTCAMKASKRKNDHVDCVAGQLTTMVINNDVGEENSTSHLPALFSDMRRTTERMRQLSDQWTHSGTNTSNDSFESGINSHNGIAEAILSILKENKNEINLRDSLLQESETVKSNLLHEIEQAKHLYSKENNDINKLSEQLFQFQETRRDLLGHIEELDDRQRTSQKNIAIYQAEASEELDLVTDVEEKQKRQVPRLKMTISLYASTTGIKWDFTDPDLLSGQVALPSQNAFKLFTIDPRDHSGVETADYLWNMMEGKNTC